MNVSELRHLAQLAQAPASDFQAWHAAVALERPTLGMLAPLQVISYKVPKGYSLVLTNVQSWVSNPLTGVTPGAPPPTAEVLNWGQLFGYFKIDDDVLTDENVFYSCLSKGGLLLIFPPAQCARFFLRNGGPTITQEFALSFIFSGYLTLPEHAARLQAMQSVVVNTSELACP